MTSNLSMKAWSWTLAVAWSLTAPAALAGGLEGWVTGLRSGDSARITVVGTLLNTASKPGGKWAIPGVPDGDYQVTAEHPNYRFEPTVRKVKLRGQAPKVNFQAIPKRTGSGKLGAVRGRVTGLQKKDKVAVNASGYKPASAKTDPKGAFLLKFKEPGRYRILPEDARYRFLPAEVAVEIGEAEVKDLEFKATKAGPPLLENPGGTAAELTKVALAGKVIGLTGNAIVRVRADGPSYAEVSSESDGSFLFPSLTTGRYSLILEPPDCDGCRYRIVPLLMTVDLTEDTSGIVFHANPEPR
jgi:hypothetical protein